MHHAEHRRAEADAEREGQDGRARCAGVRSDKPATGAQAAKKAVHGR
jgi:hypothetical protein